MTRECSAFVLSPVFTTTKRLPFLECFFPKPPRDEADAHARAHAQMGWCVRRGVVYHLAERAFTPLWTRGAVESAPEAMPAQAREEMGLVPGAQACRPRDPRPS
jgi:hypothetical protein